MGNKEGKFDSIMGWLSTVIIAIITALTYPIRYFWFKGIADYYKIDLLYVYGNYKNIIGDVFVTFAIVMLILIIFYKLYEWVVKNKDGFWALVGRGTVVFISVLIINAIFAIIPYRGSMSIEVIMAILGIGIVLAFIECIIFIPCVLIIYKSLHNQEEAKRPLGFRDIISFVIWLGFLCMAPYNISAWRIKEVKQYEIIEMQDVTKVIIAKYEDMFYIYNCDMTTNNELVIYTDEGELVNMNSVKFKHKSFDKVSIK